MREEDADRIVAARGNGYPDVESIWRRAGVHRDTLTRLAGADAFACLGLTRREALWAAKALRAPRPLPLFGADGEGIVEPAVALPSMGTGREVVEDYRSLRLSLRGHPLELLCPRLPDCLPAERLASARGRTSVAGLVITRQRPGTASGTIFLTLEDETGTANVIVWPRVFEDFRREVIAGRLLRVTGRIERDESVIHLIAERIEDLSRMLSILARPEADEAGGADRMQPPADGDVHSPAVHRRDHGKDIPSSRDFR